MAQWTLIHDTLVTILKVRLNIQSYPDSFGPDNCLLFVR